MTTLDKERDLLPSATNSLDVSHGMYVGDQTDDVRISQPNFEIAWYPAGRNARVDEWMNDR
jgi:hypothetical protein